MNQQSEYNRTTSTLAIVSLVTGILGLTFLPTVGSVIAIITGHLAKTAIKKNHGRIEGNGMATAGLILGYLNIVLIFMILCFFVTIPLFGWLFGDAIIQNLGF